MDFEEPMRMRFRENLPTFVAHLDPSQLLPHLTCLGDYNSEEIMTRQRQHSRNQAVQILHGHLIRKKDGCRQLAAALRTTAINQPDLADLLDPPKSSEPRFLGSPTEISEGHTPKVDAERQCVIDEHTQARPVDGSTLLLELPASVIYVYKMLDQSGINNWMKFAAQLDIYKTSEIGDFEKQPNPGKAVIEDWVQKQNPTLQMLIKKLYEIERMDMLYELEKITKYKCPGLDPPGIEESMNGDKTNEIDRDEENVEINNPNETDEITSAKTIPKDFFQEPIVACPDWQQLGNEDFDVSIELQKGRDKIIERMGDDTGYNTSASSSGTFDDSSIESKISDSSLEIDGSVNLSMNGDIADYPGRKIQMRYKTTNSGRLAMDSFGSHNDRDDSLDEDRSSFGNTNERVIRQESLEACRNPVQTEPSMDSNQFVNLKLERQTPDVRPKRPRPDLYVTVPSLVQESDHNSQLEQQGVTIENYLKLHTSNAPTLHDVSIAQITPEDVGNNTLKSLPEISDVCGFNSARSETDTPLTTESGFHHLDLSSITSENFELTAHDDNENSIDHYLEAVAMDEVIDTAGGSGTGTLNSGTDQEAASTYVTTSSSRSLDRNRDEFSYSLTDTSDLGSAKSITELKKGQIDTHLSNEGKDRSGEFASGTNEGKGNTTQSRGWSLRSLVMGGVGSGTNEGRGNHNPQSSSWSFRSLVSGTDEGRRNDIPRSSSWSFRSLGSGTNEGRRNDTPQPFRSLGVGDVALGTNEVRGNDNPQSGSWSSLTSLGIGVAAGVLMMAAYNKMK